MNARLVSVGVVTALLLAGTGLARADECRFRMGPYTSQATAELGVQQARNVGLSTSSIRGEGAAVSQLANNRYFFDVLFTCS